MKRIISILLAVMLVVSVSAVVTGAVSYEYTDSYTVDKDTPYTEDAVLACGGSLAETQLIYFQAPADWANKFNTFAGPDDSEPYMHVCIYWWDGIGSKWPSGNGVQWCGYQAHLVDKENRIYSARVPNDGDTPMVTWNNGVNGGMDSTQEIFTYARQLKDANVEGAEPGVLKTLPEGTPDVDDEGYHYDYNGCIQIIDPNVKEPNPKTGFDTFGYNWYVYYGGGCYGNYATTSKNFTSKHDNCVNPDHLADPDKYHPLQGDVNKDKTVDVVDVFCIQRHLAQIKQPEGMNFDEKAADVDEDSYITIIDATRIQRALAGICDIYGKKK